MYLKGTIGLIVRDWDELVWPILSKYICVAPVFPPLSAGWPTHSSPYTTHVLLLLCWLLSPGRNSGFLSPPPLASHSQMRKWDGDSGCTAFERSAARGGGEGKPELLPRLNNHWRRRTRAAVNGLSWAAGRGYNRCHMYEFARSTLCPPLLVVV